MMERSAIMTTMGELKLFGMRAAYDEIVASAVKRQHEPQRLVSDLLTAELSEKQARSIKYQIAIARLPMAKEIDEFVFDGTPINETLVRDLAGGAFLAQQRNLVLIGGTGTGKTQVSMAVPGSMLRGSPRSSSASTR
jgi:DNA replication protein DnaC